MIYEKEEPFRKNSNFELTDKICHFCKKCIMKKKRNKALGKIKLKFSSTFQRLRTINLTKA